jgi:tRNA threonylcarbamoyladenosine biosynthesis protein TsaB
MDAAAGNGTIAVLRDGTVAADADVVMRSEHEERFFPAVLDTLARAGASLDGLKHVIVGGGPGSFTALRVVGAIAKGIVQGRGIALYAVPSLALVATGDPLHFTAATRWLVTLDALRSERYAALVMRAAGGEVLSVEQLGVLPTASLARRAEELAATVIGPDEALAARPHARNVTHCLSLVQATGPVDLASWEPLYGRLAEAQVKWEAAHGRALA